MRILNRRMLAFMIALVLFIGLLSGINHTASAATVNYVTGNPSSSYRNVVKNWGTRGTTATFLSPRALAFYSKNYVQYEDLAALSGASNTASVPSSELYKKLNALVTDNQVKETTYAETRPLFAYTDCQANGTYISSFYSGLSVGPAWDGGDTWNREHTWPNSKGDANGNGENDIMMLRPTSVSENSSRSNTAYGESYGYYNPNGESGGKYDLRGDVARIMLYVYTRWGTANMWGKSGVIESKEILLKWMAADPVDTWEMGRNDSVESITGTRNVYVDFPELAFVLFGEEVPEDMVSPSNGDGVVPPTPTMPPAPEDPREILEEAYALEANAFLPYTATLTGTITQVTEAFNARYQNVTVVMEVDGCEDMPIKCFRLQGDGADQINFGDIITVTGSITKYQGRIHSGLHPRQLGRFRHCAACGGRAGHCHRPGGRHALQAGYESGCPQRYALLQRTDRICIHHLPSGHLHRCCRSYRCILRGRSRRNRRLPAVFLQGRCKNLHPHLRADGRHRRKRLRQFGTDNISA